MLSGETELGGRRFQFVNYEAISVLNEHYVMKMMRATGLDVVMPKETEDDEQYMIRVHAALIDTLKLAELLAGYLLPNGKTEADWTLAMAAQTTAYINGLTTPVDKAEVHRMGLMVTFDFFAAGLASLKHSRSVLETMKVRMGPRADETQSGAH